MVAFKYILAPLGTGSALIIQRDVNTIVFNLKITDTAANQYVKDLKAWSGDARGPLALQNDEAFVENSLNGTTQDLRTEHQLSAADGQTVASYFAGTLKPDFTAVISAIVGAKSKFSAAGLSSVARQDLQHLYDKFTAVCKALLPLVPAPPYSSIKSACENTYTICQNAIATYST